MNDPQVPSGYPALGPTAPYRTPATHAPIVVRYEPDVVRPLGLAALLGGLPAVSVVMHFASRRTDNVLLDWFLGAVAVISALVSLERLREHLRVWTLTLDATRTRLTVESGSLRKKELAWDGTSRLEVGREPKGGKRAFCVRVVCGEVAEPLFSSYEDECNDLVRRFEQALAGEAESRETAKGGASEVEPGASG